MRHDDRTSVSGWPERAHRAGPSRQGLDPLTLLDRRGGPYPGPGPARARSCAEPPWPGCAHAGTIHGAPPPARLTWRTGGAPLFAVSTHPRPLRSLAPGHGGEALFCDSRTPRLALHAGSGPQRRRRVRCSLMRRARRTLPPARKSPAARPARRASCGDASPISIKGAVPVSESSPSCGRGAVGSFPGTAPFPPDHTGIAMRSQRAPTSPRWAPSTRVRHGPSPACHGALLPPGRPHRRRPGLKRSTVVGSGGGAFFKSRLEAGDFNPRAGSRGH